MPTNLLGFVILHNIHYAQCPR